MPVLLCSVERVPRGLVVVLQRKAFFPAIWLQAKTFWVAHGIFSIAIFSIFLPSGHLLFARKSGVSGGCWLCSGDFCYHVLERHVSIFDSVF